MARRSDHNGFTLIELAIVIVATGLIVGVALVGNDLVQTSSIRSVVSDIEKINSGVNTFRAKYAGLPGDLLASKAATFNLIQGTSAAIPGRPSDAITSGRGDGNGLVEGCATETPMLGCETALFWVDLSQAAMIPGIWKTYDGTALYATDTSPANPISNFLFRTKIGDNAYLMAFPGHGRNQLALGSVSVTGGTVTIANNTPAAALSPQQAGGIDTKLDDGLPAQGTVVAITDLAMTPDTGTTTATANTCVYAPAGSPATYTGTTSTFLQNPACAIAIRTFY